MRITVRSIFGAELQTAALTGRPYRTREDTTLNERFNIHPNSPLPTGKYPTVGYIHLGLGGHRLTAGADGIALNSPVPHLAIHAGLYKPMPMVLRLQTEDLTPVERASYALRRTEVHNGENYFAYYLKRIDYTDVETKLNSTQIIEGQETTIPFVPNSSNLSPTQPLLPSDQAIPTLSEGDYVSVSMMVSIPLSQFDTAEYLKAVNIIYGSDSYGIISEVALVSAIDSVVTAEGPGGVPFQFNEAIGAQCVSFMSDYLQITSSSDTIDLNFDVGTVEPLLTELVSGTPNSLATSPFI